MLSKHSVGTYKKLTGNSSGNAQPQSSQVTQPLWTDPDLKNGIDMHKLISPWGGGGAGAAAEKKRKHSQ